MKERVLIIAAAAILCAAPLHAQCYPQGMTAADLIRQDTSLVGNNHRAYITTDLTDTKAPAGYKPFYISHYGRHGSRSDYQSESWVRVVDKLTPAREAGLLTPRGERMFQAAQKMSEEGAGMREMLTNVGVREHMQIATRMYKRFPQVFKGARDVDAKSSIVQRCVLSMGAFTTALAAQNPQLRIDMLTGDRYYSYIAKTNGYHEATEGRYQLQDAYKATLKVDTTSFLSLIFKDAEAGHKMIGSAKKLQSDIVNSGEFCTVFDVEDAFHCCLPWEVYYNAWSQKNRSLYSGHANSVEFGDRRMPIARDLMNDVISRADAAVAGNGRAADLRFGHDFPLLALVGYMGLEGVGGRYSFDEIDDNWFGSYYICMASNVQVVFYRNRKGDVLVKCLYNEKETLLPELTPVSGPYYRWSDVRDYWTTRYPAESYPEPVIKQKKAAPGLPK